MPNESVRAEFESRGVACLPVVLIALLCGCGPDKPPVAASNAPSATIETEGTGAPAPPPITNESAAESAALAWLSLVDAGKSSESWNEAATSFKSTVDEPGWEKMLAGTRVPLGAVLSRTFKSAKYATHLPGVPDGEYVVIQYVSSFENKRAATTLETVTPKKEPDGQWRVSGYFIQ